MEIVKMISDFQQLGGVRKYVIGGAQGILGQ
jgi:hypothetical protein